jgi:hypothetical protein
VQRKGGVIAVGPNGQVGLAAAEQAFIALWGPLPGVRKIPGAVNFTHVTDATGPALWIRAHLKQLTRRQRQIVERALAGPSTSGATKSDAAGEAALANLINTVAANIGSKVGYTLPFTPSARFAAPATLPKQKGEAVLGLSQSVGNPINGCAIEINEDLAANSTELVDTTAHEVTHCFQFALARTDASFNKLPQFLVEGYAEWAGDAYAEEYMGAHYDDPFSSGWVDNPFADLFQRTYDAFGLYTDIGSNAGNEQFAWSLLQPMIAKRSATAIYNLLRGLFAPDFEANLATNNLLSPQLGPRWTYGGPGIEHGAPEFRDEKVGNGDTVTIAAPPRAADRAALDLSADVVKVTGDASGALHLSDGRTLDTGPMTLCQLQEGCRCPNGTNPTTEGGAMGNAIIAIWGGLGGNRLKLEGKSKLKACQQQGVTLTGPAGAVIAIFEVDARCSQQASTLTARLPAIGGGGPMTVELPGFVEGEAAKFTFHAPRGSGGVVTYGPYSSGFDLSGGGPPVFSGGVGYNGRRFFIDADMFTEDASQGGIAAGVFSCLRKPTG